PAGRAGFTLLRPEDSGLLFTNHLSYERGEANQNLLDGFGVAAGDYDGDGHCDLFVASGEGPCGLFRNLGNGRFANVTAAAGVEAAHQSTKGVVFADVNGDGRLDLFCAALGGPNALFLNLGGGRFTNTTAAAGLASRAGAHSAALADVDGDGDLDLYVANYGENSILRSGGQVSVRMVNGRPTVTGRHARRLRIIDGAYVEYGEPHALWINDGAGKFTAASWTDGRFLTMDGQPLKSEQWDMGLSVLFRDINGDTHPDLYVCNDFQSPDRIWINDGRGHFRALPDLALRVTSHFSMGVDFADIDRDGFDDFFIGDMLSRRHALRMTQLGATNPLPSYVGERLDRVQERRNVLAWNRGDGTYADIAWFAGVAASDWTWSVVFLDVDLDGYEDLLTVNGHAFDVQDLDLVEGAPEAQGTGMNRQIGKALKNFPPLITPNYAFRNRRDRTFGETGGAWGFNSTNVSHGIALTDFDNDGDLDVAVSCLWQPPLLYRNESPAPRVAVRLRGLAPNTRGIGARVKLLGGAVPEQSQEMHCGGRYLSADDTMRTFAAGNSSGGMTLEVTWRSGKRSVVREVKPNHLYEIDEAAAAGPAPTAATPASRTPQFTDVSAALNLNHERTAFNDLERQPMLIRMLSQAGPGVALCDLDGDGHDDVVVGAGTGGRLALARGDGKGSFARVQAPAWQTPCAGDPAGFAAWGGSLLMGVSGYRSPAPSALESLTVDSRAAVAGGGILERGLGPVVTADFDGDGVLDVFVGGRVVPGRYPEAATSVVLRPQAGRLAVDAGWSGALKRVGLVSGAAGGDLDGDGFPELVLACEWGPVRVFRRAGAALRDVTAELGLAGFTGWWTGVTIGDVDGDGRLD
ncbi:MAG TPA: VCBS repeat-containing protein, partial [Longimicrobium sp.]